MPAAAERCQHCGMPRRDFWDHARVVWVSSERRVAHRDFDRSRSTVWVTLRAEGFPAARFAKLVNGELRIQGPVSLQATLSERLAKLGAEASARKLETTSWFDHQLALKKKRRRDKLKAAGKVVDKPRVRVSRWSKAPKWTAWDAINDFRKKNEI